MILNNMETTSETSEDNVMDDSKDITAKKKKLSESVLIEGGDKYTEDESERDLNKTKNIIDVVDISNENEDLDSKGNCKKNDIEDDKTGYNKDIVENSCIKGRNDMEELETTKNLNKDNSILENRSSPSSVINKYNKMNGEENKVESLVKEGRRKRRISRFVDILASTEIVLLSYSKKRKCFLFYFKQSSR